MLIVVRGVLVVLVGTSFVAVVGTVASSTGSIAAKGKRVRIRFIKWNYIVRVRVRIRKLRNLTFQTYQLFCWAIGPSLRR